MCRADADRHRLGEWLAKCPFQPPGRCFGGLRIKKNVEMCRAEARKIRWAGPHGGDDIHINANVVQQRGDFDHIVTMAKA